MDEHVDVWKVESLGARDFQHRLLTEETARLSKISGLPSSISPLKEMWRTFSEYISTDDLMDRLN